MKNNGFTLVEILVVIGIIAVLASVVLVAINPARQFKLARDSQRSANIRSLLDAVHENMSEHAGVFTCAGTSRAFPASPMMIRSGSGYPTYPGDIASCLVPDYLSELPFDPVSPGAHYASTTDYDTGYEMWQNGSGRIIASSTGELTSFISVTR